MTGLTQTVALREHLEGVVLTAGDDGYEEARTLFNGMIDVRPAVIVQCANARDVQAALRFGREQGLDIAVRAGGHSVAGMSTVEDGLVIDVRNLKGVTVDPRNRTARCGAGCTWGEFDAATQQHGLATPGGRVSTTGVAGFTLGGGSGWLERKHGFACDNLRAVELVTAEGRLIRTSPESHPELFWALHGGGGNFGIATALEFDVHPVGPIVMAGLMLWPADRGREVTATFRDLMDRAPRELTGGVVYLYGPPEPFVPAELQGALCVGVPLLWAGDPADGEVYAATLQALQPAVDLVGPMPYTEFNRMIDDPPGMRNYWSADYLAELGDGAIDVFVEHSERMPEPSQSILFPWGGAVADVTAEQTPMAKRDATWVSHPFAVWEHAADDAAYIGWARALTAAMKPHTTGGIYLNFIGDEGDDRIRAAYGDSYDRMARVKRTYDPDNVFRGNQNIKPAA